MGGLVDGSIGRWFDKLTMSDYLLGHGELVEPSPFFHAPINFFNSSGSELADSASSFSINPFL